MDLRQFLLNQTWITAKTYAKTAPHEYIVREKVGQDNLFTLAAAYIQTNGFKAKFWGKEYIYFRIDNHLYWTMGGSPEEIIIINRCSYDNYDVIVVRRKDSEDK